MTDRFGFLTLRRSLRHRIKKPPTTVRPLFTPLASQRPASTSVPSLAIICDKDSDGGYTEDNEEDDVPRLRAESVSTLPGNSKAPKQSKGVDELLAPVSRAWSNLSLLHRVNTRRTNLIRSFSTRRVSKSVASLPSKVVEGDDALKIQNENLATSTQAVSEALDEEVSKEKQMGIGRKKFNIDPKKGIEYLVQNGLLTHKANDVAQFLFTGEGLNKSQIGDYLGEFRDFNLQVLHEFIELQDFTGLGLLEALRQFLWTFHPPGEAQKIERLLEGFANRYWLMNAATSPFESAGGAFTLAFCCVILNTLLHNPSVRQKPPLSVFVEMVNLEQDLPTDMLLEIYESLQREPFRRDDGADLMTTFFNPDREGWLWKRGGRVKSWKRRWFIMTGRCLYYFEYTTDKEFRGIIPLENIKVRDVRDRRMSNCFEIFNEGSRLVKACKTSRGKVVEGRHTVYRISATSSAEKQLWMEAIRKSTMFNPLYKLLEETK